MNIYLRLTLFCLIYQHTAVAKPNLRLGMLDRHAKLLLAQYEAAKKVYKIEAYAEAKSLFDTLRKIEHPPSLSPYIHFYYGLAAYHNGEKAIAHQSFLEIQAKFPAWSKQNEIHYWCAQCSFEEGRVEEALGALALIKDKHMARSVLQLKKFFLKKIEDDAYLEELIEKFPNDPIIKTILHKKVAREAYLTQDFSLVNQLKQKYNFADYTYDPLKQVKSKHKAAYDVAVLLPLFVDELDYEACTDQFVIDLYQGIQLAIERLAQDGIVINLFTFDTKKNVEVTKALLAQEAMAYMDLIIGPLYPDTIPLVAAFAKKNKINFVNPISDNSTVTHGNPFAFLFQPDLETCAQRAAALTLSDIYGKATVQPCIGVFYGMKQKDILQATLYKHRIEQQLGKSIDLFVQLSDKSIKNFLKENTTQEKEKNIEDTEQTQLDLAKLTHIYVPSQDELVVSTVISLCLKLGIKPQIIGHEQWIKNEILNIYQLQRLPILFLSPNYIDYSRATLSIFRKNFFEKNGTKPNEKSYIGYEMMLFFGRMLGKYGTYFQKKWENMYYSGLIFQGVSYGKHHTNQHIPVLRFEKDKFIPFHPLKIKS
ncbi:hypothetical protein ACRRVB_01960 [Candidatus Cardinium hertigii]|uniref:hypothetical protein n=1 Tax=Candidatus Cardinium hertigii TaxID=247481 RepID=UPI003D7EF44D